VIVYDQAVSARPPIRTEIIPGGEVGIREVDARYNDGRIVVSGTGFEIFPGRTCGYPEVSFVDANGRILFRKSAIYRTSNWRKPLNPFRGRLLSFSVSVPESPAVTSVFVRHQSTGGCEDAWSLQYTLDWLTDKISPSQENKANHPPAYNVKVGKAIIKDSGAPGRTTPKE
jgi:hypothetical protein